MVIKLESDKHSFVELEMNDWFETGYFAGKWFVNIETQEDATIRTCT